MSGAPDTAKAHDPRLMALIVSIAMFMAMLSSTVITPALPEMARSFGVTPVAMSIALVVNFMAMAAFQPMSGWVADRFGARSVFVAAIVGFVAASVLCGLCQTLWQFVGARILQAMAATLMTPVGRVMLMRSTEKSDYVRVMTIATTPGLVAPILGPPIGGIITDTIGWHWIFFLNIPIGILGVVLALKFLPNPMNEERRPFDIVGLVLNAVWVCALLYGVETLAHMDAERWWLTAGLIGAGLATGAAAIRHSLRHPYPLVPLEPVRIQSFRAASIVGGPLARLPIQVISYVLPILFVAGFGMSASQFGLVFLAHAAGDFSLKAITTQTFRRFGFRSTMMASTAVMCALISLFAFASAQTPLWMVFLLLLVSGGARSMTFTGLSVLSFVDLPKAQMGGAQALSNMVMQVGASTAVSLAALLMTGIAVLRGGEAPGVFEAKATLAICAGLGLLAVVAFSRLPRDVGQEVSGHGVKR